MECTKCICLGERSPLLDEEQCDEQCDEYGPSEKPFVSDQKSYEEAITVTGYGRFHYGLLALCGWALSSDAIEVLSISFVLPAATCDLNMTSNDKGWLTAIMFVGMMFGGYIWGSLADVYGRRSVLLWSLTINGLGGLASSFAPNFGSFLFLRFTSGIGVGGSLPVVFAYFTEFQPKERRGSMISLLATFWMSGNIIAAALAWLIIPMSPLGHFINDMPFNSWRFYLVICTIPAITSGLAFTCMPESPRFLMELGRKEEALKVFEKMYKANNSDSQEEFAVKDLQCQFKKLDISSESDGNSNLCYKMMNTVKRVWQSITQLFQAPLTLVSILMIIIYFTLSFGYYGLYMWFPELFARMELTGGSPCSLGHSTLNVTMMNLTINSTCDAGVPSFVYFETFLTAVSNLPGNIFTIILIDRLGRKHMLAGSMVLSAISVFFIVILESKSQSLIFSCIFGGISVIGWNALDVLSMEVIPTDLRSTATGLYMGIGRLGAILANITFGVLVDVYCMVPMLMVGGFMTLGGLLALLLPKTSHLDLT